MSGSAKAGRFSFIFSPFFLGQMAPWVRCAFVDVLPKFLFIQRPERDDDPVLFDQQGANGGGGKGGSRPGSQGQPSPAKLPISHSALTTNEDVDIDRSVDCDQGSGGGGKGSMPALLQQVLLPTSTPPNRCKINYKSSYIFT